MATEQSKEEILIDVKSTASTAQVEAMMNRILAVIEKLPGITEKTNGPINAIIQSLRQINLNESLNAKDALSQIKELRAQLTLISTASKATKLFESSGLSNIEAEIQAVKRLEKAYAWRLKEQTVLSGQHGLNAQNTKEAGKAIRDLEQASNRVQAKLSGGMGDEAALRQQLLMVQANIAALQKLIQLQQKAAEEARARIKSVGVDQQGAELVRERQSRKASQDITMATVDRQEQSKRTDRSMLTATVDRAEQGKRTGLSEMMAELERKTQGLITGWVMKMAEINRKEEGVRNGWIMKLSEIARKEEGVRTGWVMRMAELDRQAKGRRVGQDMTMATVDRAEQGKRTGLTEKMAELDRITQGVITNWLMKRAEIDRQEEGVRNGWIMKMAEINRKEEGVRNGWIMKMAELDRQVQVRKNSQEMTMATVDRAEQGKRTGVGMRLAEIDRQEQGKRYGIGMQVADIERAQQLNPARQLSLAFKGLNIEGEHVQDYGSARLQKVDQEAPGRVQAAQREVLALQMQIAAAMRNKVQLEEQDKHLIDEVIAAKLRELALSRELGTAAKEQEAVERMLARTRGTAGAALLTVQAALAANYALLNGFTNGIRDAIRNAVEFEAAMKNVQAVTATTDTEMVSLTKTVKAVAAESKFTSVEVANAALTLGQAGLSAKQVEATLGSVVTLANASGSNIAQAVDLVTSVVGVFDKAASDAADVANKITKASNDSKVSVDKLALAFQYVGNTASQMGISFEEVTASLATMSNAGIKSGSTMGTGLRQFLVEVQKPSEEFIKSMNQVGLTVSDLDFKANGLIGVLKNLHDAGFVASDAVKSFDIRGAAAFNALIADPAALERQYRGLIDTNAAMDANAIQMDSLKSQASRLKTALENLTEAALSPATQALKALFSGLATVTQAASELGPILGIVGSALVGLAAAATINWLGGLALGLTQTGGLASLLSGALGILGAAFTSLGTLATAAWATIAGSATAATAATTAATGAATVGFAGMGTAATAATAATTGLTASVTLLGVATGIGLIAALGAAGYYLYNKWAEDAKKRIDELKAGVNNAKAAVEEKATAIESLTKKIQSLSLREKDLEKDTEGTKTEIIEAISKHGQWGFSLDMNTAKIGDLIGKLKELREELKQLSRDDMEEAAKKAATLAAAKTEEAQKRAGKFTQTKFARSFGSDAGLLENLLKNPDALKTAGLNDRQVDSLQEAVKDIREHANEPLKITQANTAARVLGRIDTAKLPDLQRNIVETLKKSLSDLGSTITEARSADNEAKSMEQRIQKDDDYKAANKTFAKAAEPQAVKDDTYNAASKAFSNFPAMKGKTFDEVMDVPYNIDAMAKSQLGDEGAKNPVKLEQKAREIGDRIRLTMKGYLAVIDAMQIPDDTKKQMQARVKGVMQDIQNQQGKVSDLAKVEFTEITEDEKIKQEYRLKTLMARVKPGLLDPAEHDEAESLIRQKHEREFRKKTFGMPTDSRTFASAKTARDFAMQEELDQLATKWREAEKQVAEQSLKIEEQSLKVATDAAIRQAKEIHSRVTPQMGLEEIGKKAEEGLKVLAQARAAEKAALEKKIAAQDTKGDKNTTGAMQDAWEDERAKLDEKWDHTMNDYVNQFSGLITKAANYAYDLTKKIKDLNNKLEHNFIEAEKRLYEADDPLRKKDLELARAKGPVSSRGVSETEAFLLERQREPLALESVRRQISTKQADYDYIGDGITSGKLQEMKAAAQLVKDKLAETEASKTSLLNGREEGSLKGLEHEKLLDFNAVLDATKKAATDADAEVNKLDKRAKTLRDELVNLKKSEAGLTPPKIEDLTWESFQKDMEMSWEAFKIQVKEMNPNKVLTDGFTGVLSGITSTVGQAFASMVTGTKSVGRAFRDMATSIIKSMIDIMAQALAMQAVKGIMSALGLGASVGTAYAGTAYAGTMWQAGGSSTFDAGISTMGTMAATGGYFNNQGVLERVRKMAGGGPVTGGTPGKDSVPVLAMPGEFMLNKKAVDAVGTDYLHGLNEMGNSVVSSSTARAPRNQNDQTGGVLNVWVVTPDQKPQMGPKDVVAVVSDDISRGGPIKQLVKQIQLNQV